MTVLYLVIAARFMGDQISSMSFPQYELSGSKLVGNSLNVKTFDCDLNGHKGSKCFVSPT